MKRIGPLITHAVLTRLHTSFFTTFDHFVKCPPLCSCYQSWIAKTEQRIVWKLDLPHINPCRHCLHCGNCPQKLNCKDWRRRDCWETRSAHSGFPFEPLLLFMFSILSRYTINHIWMEKMIHTVICLVSCRLSNWPASTVWGWNPRVKCVVAGFLTYWQLKEKLTPPAGIESCAMLTK